VVHMVIFSGRKIISAARDQTLHIWNLEGEMLEVLSGHRDWLNCVDVKGGKIISSSWDYHLHLWSDNNTNHEPTIFRGHMSAVSCCKFCLGLGLHASFYVQAPLLDYLEFGVWEQISYFVLTVTTLL